MKFNVVYNKKIPNYQYALENLTKELDKYDIEYKTFDIETMENYGDLTLTLGGDGTILRTAKFYSKYQTPVLGINIGRLGFLAQPEEMHQIVKAVLEKKYYTEERLMLSSSDYIALNDFVIKGCDQSRSSKFYLEINGKTVCDYIADGIIISTPTGSTAYCLSANGPVLYPTLDSIVIVPICPHTLNARPIVIPAGELIKVKTSDKLLSVAIDGYTTIECVEEIQIETAKTKSVLAFLNERKFYYVLRDKLHWGISPEKTI